MAATVSCVTPTPKLLRTRARGIAGHREHLLDAWRRYRIPVALTEVHLACTREEQMRWLLEAWQGAHQAAAAGARVVAITPWALLGSYDWDSLVVERRDHYEPGAFDVRAPEPRPTALVPMIRQLARGETPQHSAFARPGWWRRPDRLLYAQAPTDRDCPVPSRPLLVLGARGTLGRAFTKIAAERGLPSTGLARADADITDSAAAARAIQRLNPWAVINATGYVRVDDAERDCDACFGVNTIGAENIANACRQLGLPLVSYSSDLVFDGNQAHPYTETRYAAPAQRVWSEQGGRRAACARRSCRRPSSCAPAHSSARGIPATSPSRR